MIRIRNCNFVEVPSKPNKLVCSYGCGIEIPISLKGQFVRSDCQAPIYGGFGQTGNILKGLLDDVGAGEIPGCSCQATIEWMNRIGPQGCQDQIEAIINKLRESRELVSWSKMVAIGAATIKTGLILKIGIKDPLRSLVLEAIRLARLEG